MEGVAEVLGGGLAMRRRGETEIWEGGRERERASEITSWAT